MKRIYLSCLLLLPAAVAAAQTITTTAAPNSIAINPVTNKIYLTDPSINKLTVINGATGSVATTGKMSDHKKTGKWIPATITRR